MNENKYITRLIRRNAARKAVFGVCLTVILSATTVNAQTESPDVQGVDKPVSASVPAASNEQDTLPEDLRPRSSQTQKNT